MLAARPRARVAAGELRGDSDTLARAFVGMVGASVLAQAVGDAAAPDDAADRLVDLFLHGCATGTVTS